MNPMVEVNVSRAHYLVFMCLLLLNLQVISVSLVEGNSDELTEGQHPLYIIKEVVEVTSDWTIVQWSQGPHILAVRYNVKEGADAPEFQYRVSGLNVWVTKRSFDTTKVVIELEALTLRGDTTALINIYKGHIMNSKIEIDAYDSTANNFVNLGEFLNNYSYPIDFELDLSMLYHMPSSTVHVEASVKELKRKVFTFYYPWYANPLGPSDLLFHWDGITAESIGSSTNYPLMGAYDSADDNVILAHMAMAKQAGIDGFISSWWGIDHFVDKKLSRILEMAEKMSFQISIYYETVRDISKDDIVDELTYVVDSYAGSSAFLKDSGRPVIFVYAVSSYGRDPSFWLEVRRRVEANVGPMVLIGDTVDAEYSHVFDGFHTYIFLGENVEDFYRGAIERLRVGLPSIEVDDAFSSAYTGEELTLHIKPFSLTVIPGYDDTKVRSPGLKVDRREGKTLANYWETALELDPHSVLITSWNEWHEGTDIEPSREYRFEYINMIRKYIEEYKQTSIPLSKANFTVRVDSFKLYPNLTGSGRIVITPGEVSAIYVNVSISGDEGLSSIGIQGDFYSYVQRKSDTYASILIPSTPLQDELDIRVVYEAVTISPLFNISVTAFDPSGRPYELYKGKLRHIAMSSTTGSTSSESVEYGESVAISSFLSPGKEGEIITLLFTKPDSSTFTRSISTDADGSFCEIFEPDVVGKWVVKASWEGDMEFEGSTGLLVSIIVEKASTNLSIKTSESLISKGESITISGSLNPAVPGADVSIDFTKPDGLKIVRTVTTGSDGSYSDSFIPTETGSWNVEASWEGNSTYREATSQTVKFNVVEPPPTGSLEIIVHYENENPINGAIVSSTSQPIGQQALLGTSRADGSVTFSNVNVGDYTIHASKSGFETNSESVTVIEGETATLTIHLKEQVGTLKILVDDKEGNTISGATVTSTSQPSGQPSLSGTTESDGSVTFNDVKHGSYNFQASKSGYITGIETVTASAAETAEMTITLEKENPFGGIPGFPYESIILGLLAGVFLLWKLLEK